MEEKVTFVLTSCGRVDLLKQTLSSFFRYNDYPIERYIVVEDSCDRMVAMACEEMNKMFGNKIEFVFNNEKLGKTASIDSVYPTITTPYIFHCEDDWQFYAKGFIQKSLSVMRDRPELIQTMIRPKSDGILNPIATKVFQSKEGVPFRRVLPVSFYSGVVLEDGNNEIIYNYMGFSFDPGLKRISDYNILGSGGYKQFDQEYLIDRFYKDLGYSTMSITNNDMDGYVKKIKI